MTSEAPERIIVAKCHPFKEPDDFYVCHPQLKHPAGIEYIRADLPQQAIAEAEARGYAQAVEDAYNALFPIPAASMEQEQMAQRCQSAIRALSPATLTAKS